ncbi:MAG: SBBP repeat-containing protein [Candidatus Zixiibacteriota bacterium]|nr:MAG: SBBP repeat-containing protein [candidate division Zixibacteria bacterium]
MSKSVITGSLLALFVLAASALPSGLEVTATGIVTSTPLAFTENRGQWDSQVLFRADAGSATMWFTTDGAYYQFTRTMDDNDADPEDLMEPQADGIEAIVIKASFVGANAGPPVSGEGLLDYNCNYFLGDDPAAWRTGVPNYNAVIYEEIYPGIDLKYYGNGMEMEYDFMVSPGADHSQIEIQYEGVESVSVNDAGELVVTTAWGEVIERRPVVYQLQDDTHMPVDGQYRLLADNSFGFSLGAGYDPTLPLVIDPILSYSTYLGGGGSDVGRDIAVDADGAVYVIGGTNSTNFPTLNPFQTSFQGGAGDVFVTKLSAVGNNLIYSTYLGGSSSDIGYDIAVDGSGAVYLTGETNSTNFPTQNPFQTNQDGQDAFVAKLSAAGNDLIYSTYLGGSSSYDYGYGIAVDVSGAAFVTGVTKSSDFPTQNPYQTEQRDLDAFVTKLSADGNSLVYSTYLGGSVNDRGLDIAVDASGSAYVTGWTLSSDFPMQNPFQTQQGEFDAFVTKLSASGNSLVYSTCLGGSYRDYGRGIEVDADGAAYVTGLTLSSDFPTLNPFQPQPGNIVDAFVTKLSASGSGLVYSTYLGGSAADEARGIAVDAYGAAYVTGQTSSADFPTLNPFQASLQGGDNDAFVTKLSSSGNSLAYSTYLGGGDQDEGRGIAVDGAGAAYVTGWTLSSDFPTLNPFQVSSQGSEDVFVTKLSSGSFARISGTVTVDATALKGVAISLYDETNELLSVTTTDFGGLYSFDALEPGSYLVTVLVPLGFEVTAGGESQIVIVEGGQTSVADFELTEAELLGSQRTCGFWAHQVNALVTGHGTPAISESEMCGYLASIRTHFNEHPVNPVMITYLSEDCSFNLPQMQVVIAPRINPSDGEVARAHLAALLLNVVSARLSQMAVISDDDATVSQAITRCNLLLTDFTEINDDSAKVIAETINKGRVLPAGWIPLSTPQDMYKQEGGGLPGTFSLSQNYPNPFNPVTEIEFALPKACHARLEIYNIVGQRVTTLVNRQMEAGLHTVNFDGSKVASGVYMYRLQAGDFVESKKMLLLK